MGVRTRPPEEASLRGARRLLCSLQPRNPKQMRYSAPQRNPTAWHGGRTGWDAHFREKLKCSPVFTGSKEMEGPSCSEPAPRTPSNQKQRGKLAGSSCLHLLTRTLPAGGVGGAGYRPPARPLEPTPSHPPSRGLALYTLGGRSPFTLESGVFI